MRKSEVEEREKRARSWCHKYLFLISLLLVSNDINRHGNFKRKSRVKRFEKSKSRITLLCPMTTHAAYLGPITLIVWVPWCQRCVSLLPTFFHRYFAPVNYRRFHVYFLRASKSQTKQKMRQLKFSFNRCTL